MQHARADMEAAFLNDREAMIADKLEVRNAEFARLAEAIENRLDTWRDDAQKAVWSGIRNVMAENTKETLRLVGTVASFVPGGQLVGAVCSLGAGTISAVQGNKTEAAIEFVCAVPGLRNIRGQTAALKGSVGLGARNLVRGTTRVIGGTTRMTARAATGGFRAITNGQTWRNLGWAVRRPICAMTGGRWCFVGDTFHARDELPEGLAGDVMVAGNEGWPPWLWPAVAAGAGAGSLIGLEMRRRKKKKAAKVAALDKLFGDEHESEFLGPREADLDEFARSRNSHSDRDWADSLDWAHADLIEESHVLCLTADGEEEQ